MTPQRPTQTLASGSIADLRATRRRVRRDEFGLCLCGTPVAWHFDDDNRCLPCTDQAVDQARFAFSHRLDPRAISFTSVGTLSDDDTELALTIFRKREY